MVRKTTKTIKRVLSIDGGGIKGVFPASFLACIEEIIEDDISNYFDLIVGTSTGGIISLGLGLGLSASQGLAFYEDYGPKIFVLPQDKVNLPKVMSFLLWYLRKRYSVDISRSEIEESFFCPKYDPTPLRQSLETVFKDKILGESKTRLVIPSLNAETGEVHVFKTSHHPRLQYDWREKAVDVAMATSAAPSYFPAYRMASGLPLIDGGMWANNPVAVAVVEALSILNWPVESIRVLSISCTSSPINIHQATETNAGKLYWMERSIDTFMKGQSSSALGTAKLLLGDSSHFVRIDPCVSIGRFSLDGIKSIQSLKGLGKKEARIAFNRLKEMFIDPGIVEPFVPCNS